MPILGILFVGSLFTGRLIKVPVHVTATPTDPAVVSKLFGRRLARYQTFTLTIRNDRLTEEVKIHPNDIFMKAFVVGPPGSPTAHVAISPLKGTALIPGVPGANLANADALAIVGPISIPPRTSVERFVFLPINFSGNRIVGYNLGQIEAWGILYGAKYPYTFGGTR